jgi:hypothetical protein
MAVCVNTVDKYPLHDFLSPVFIFERLCSIIFPVSMMHTANYNLHFVGVLNLIGDNFVISNVNFMV